MAGELRVERGGDLGREQNKMKASPETSRWMTYVDSDAR